MRILWIVAVSAFLGTALAVLLVEPDAASGSAPIAAPAKGRGTCEQGLCESMIWLRTPVMRRNGSGN
jgi:hypothetical protein